jgi:hypothetical protein
VTDRSMNNYDGEEYPEFESMQTKILEANKRRMILFAVYTKSVLISENKTKDLLELKDTAVFVFDEKSKSFRFEKCGQKRFKKVWQGEMEFPMSD